MKEKIIGILICILLITTAIPAVKSLNNKEIVVKEPDTNQLFTKINWSEIQKLIGFENDYFGWSVSLSGATALIGAYGSHENGGDSGSAYVFICEGTNWTQQAKLLASDGKENDRFGVSVSLSGDTALIGADYAHNDEIHTGAVYVFIRTGSSWTQQAKLLASDGKENDRFGSSVSLCGDTALIGADKDNNGFGSAYVFTRSDTTWTQQAKLLASDGEGNDRFGSSVSLSGDTALIGAPWAGNANFTGSVYIFSRTDTSWTQQTKLNGTFYEFFGTSVSLSTDTALIGAIGAYGNGSNTGSVYVYIRTGTTWMQQAKLFSSDGVTGDYFGQSVSLSDNTALIGSYGSNEKGVDSGSAYVFIRTGTTWNEQEKLFASDGATNDFFGISVSLCGDTALIGADGDGSAYIFMRKNLNEPPKVPLIEGETNGKIKKPYSYTFVATDPDENKIYYLINWSDGTGETSIGPYASGEEVKINHTWSTKGTYVVKAKARDVNGAESDWGNLEVKMPCSYENSFMQFWLRFLHRFPHSFPIIRYLLGY